ncbi:MAG: CoB--CoM heterodisulfide reductase iron-sulfur subunit B family protein [Gemmatimonadetes bacterium]|nr:CoB--CoM heterodisulfide reductase iron-sulfur subunit B family protein [Gemmatimonadota bacterium]
MELSYFPGCSLHSTASEYDASTRAVCEALEIDLRELEDWNCCGSTSAHSMNAELAKLLPARNLEIAGRAGLDLMIPCAACYSRSKMAEMELAEAGEVAVETSANGQIRIDHILDVLAEAEVLDKIRGSVTRKLEGLKAVCYYGCLTVRPPKVTGARNPENPESMDRLVEVTGAEAIPWSYKTDCCGASLTLTRSDVVLKLIDRLLVMAQEAGAECVVVACSMCHANLDARQKEAAAQFGRNYGIPVLYISELLGLAMDVPESSQWWKRHLVDPTGLLSSKGFVQ